MAWGNNDNSQSDYNAAQLKVLRLHDSWVLCRKAWRNCMKEELKDELNILYMELEADAKKPELDKLNEYDKKIIEIEKDKSLKSQDKIPRVFFWLRKKWILLQQVEKKAGYRTKYRNESDDELD